MTNGDQEARQRPAIKAGPAVHHQWVIFTDLDGTLLDRETYGFQAAAETVRRLVAAGIPIVFCSSKTESEQRDYQRRLGIRAPLIIENGGAILIPADECGPDGGLNRIELGIPAVRIREHLAALQQETGIGFTLLSQASIAEVCRLTNLSPEAARRARARFYSETLFGRFSRSEIDVARQFLDRVGLELVKGTRFYTVTSKMSDKGRAVRYLIDWYQERLGPGEILRTLAIGDGRNDLTMLRSVEIGILLCRNSDDWPDARNDPGLVGLEIVTVVADGGPETWSKVVNKWVGF